MTNKEWLRRGWRLQEEIDQLNGIIEKARAEPAFAEGGCDEYMRQMIGYAAEKKRVLQEIETAIEAVDNPTLRIILRKRYIEFKPVSVIAWEEHYAERQVYRFLRLAEKDVIQCQTGNGVK